MESHQVQVDKGMAGSNLASLQVEPVPLPSPTLTNPDMILPCGYSRSPSPTQLSHRPPSPTQILLQLKAQSQIVRAQRSVSPRAIYPETSIFGLPNIAEVDTPKKSCAREDVLASSPILKEPPRLRQHSKVMELEADARRGSNASSIRSEDLENMRWPGFDMDGASDDGDINFEDDVGMDGPLPKVADEDIENDQWLDGQDDGDGDSYSHSALSRRAEIILANAKKRLNLMEGNLRGARHSLMVTPASSVNPLKMASELSTQLSAARDRDRQIYSSLGFIPSRSPQSRSPTMSSAGAAGHSRVMSETSIPSPLASVPGVRMQMKEQRSSSAMGSVGGSWKPMKTAAMARSSSIRATRSQEVMRESQGNSWSPVEDKNAAREPPDSRSSSRNQSSTPENETTPTGSLRRSGSTTSDLRVQMQELKGRISSLQQRAREESLRRRSMQSLRTPSPFTASEVWYPGVDGYKIRPAASDPPDAPSPHVSQSQRESEPASSGEIEGKPAREGGAKQPSPPPVPQPELPTDDPVKSGEDQFEDARELPTEIHDIPEEPEEEEEAARASQTPPAGDVPLDEPTLPNDDELDMDDESIYESVYEDALYHPPDGSLVERHEDRADAFDYEHFFLHSAMGSFSRPGGESLSSSDSVATPRAMSPVPESSETPTPTREQPGLHHRNQSVDSISSMATFETAREGKGSEYDDDDDGPHDRLDAAVFGHNAARAAGNLQDALSDRADSGVILADGLDNPASAIVSILLRSKSDAGISKAVSQQDRELVQALATSFHQICTKLQSTTSDQYEQRQWRQRLDEARKVLDGEREEGKSEAF